MRIMMLQVLCILLLLPSLEFLPGEDLEGKTLRMKLEGKDGVSVHSLRAGNTSQHNPHQPELAGGDSGIRVVAERLLLVPTGGQGRQVHAWVIGSRLALTAIPYLPGDRNPK